MRSDVRKITSGAYRAGSLAFLVALAAIVAALGFEHLGGYVPCPLCLQQRYAYYLAIPLLFAGLVLYTSEKSQPAALLFAVVALAFLLNAILGIYHAGAELKLWEGPATCAASSANVSASAADLMRSLGQTRIIRCDEAPWHLFGLSFAGWNALISAFLCITAFQAAYAAQTDARLARE